MKYLNKLFAKKCLLCSNIDGLPVDILTISLMYVLEQIELEAWPIKNLELFLVEALKDTRDIQF